MFFNEKNVFGQNFYENSRRNVHNKWKKVNYYLFKMVEN